MDKAYPNRYRYLVLIPIPALIIVIAILALLNINIVFEPPLLFPILNTVFIFAISFAVAYISARSYLASGPLSILLLGCGILAYGSGGLFGGWLIAAPNGPNLNVTIFNTGALLGSIFHFVGAVLTSIRVSSELEPERRKRRIILAYLGVLIFIILLTITSLQGFVPSFFIQGVGPTLVRQIVLGTAVALFATSALLFMSLYLRSRESFLYWYTLGLMLIAIGLFTVFPISNIGSLMNWAGRIAQYLGGIYFLIAILTTIRKARTQGIPLERALANFFRESEANFRALVEAANDAIVSFGSEGRVLLWNPAAERMFGYSRIEAIGSLLVDIIIPDRYADSLRKDIENFTITGKSDLIGKTTEMEAKRKDGKVFPAEFSIAARKTAEGWIYISIIRDISERKRAEQALLKSEKHYRSLFENMLDGFAYCKMFFDDYGNPVDFVYLEVNNAFERLTGLKNVVGKKVTEVIPGIKESQPEFFEIYGRVALTGKPEKFEIELKLLRIWLSISVYSPQREYFVAVFENITERKRSEEELRRRTEDLVRANAELEQFTYIAAHDLQEPLRMVSIFTQLLAKRYKGRLDKDADEFIAYIVGGATRMQQMIEDILIYSRIGTQGKPFEPTGLETVLNQVITDLEAVIAQNNAVITHDPLPTVMADASQMVQLFQNLIANAIKFRKKEVQPRIHISAKRERDEWVISVRDNGIGISPEFMGNLFHIFQREYPASEYPGTGVGLAICRRIVERHGGRIWAEAEVGKGSVFYFTIPVREEGKT